MDGFFMFVSSGSAIVLRINIQLDAKNKHGVIREPHLIGVDNFGRGWSWITHISDRQVYVESLHFFMSATSGNDHWQYTYERLYWNEPQGVQ